MSEYEPELGQAIFGQPHKEYKCSALLEAALTLLRERLSVALWNNLQRRVGDPFGNSGASFAVEGLYIDAYSWGDDEQPWNFKCGDVEVSWYKYLGRGMSASADYTPQQVCEMLDMALAILDGCDTPAFGEDARPRNFTHSDID